MHSLPCRYHHHRTLCKRGCCAPCLTPLGWKSSLELSGAEQGTIALWSSGLLAYLLFNIRHLWCATENIELDFNYDRKLTCNSEFARLRVAFALYVYRFTGFVCINVINVLRSFGLMSKNRG